MSDPDLILHLPFDRTDQPDQLDRSAKRRPVTWVGAPMAEISAIVGAATYFDRTDALQATLAGLGDGQPVFTLSCWLLVEEAPVAKDTILLLGQGGGGVSWQVGADGRLALALGTASPIQQDFPIGTWRHVALVHDGRTVSCLLDGKPMAEARAASLQLAGSALRVGHPGGAAGQTGFKGALAHLRLHARALADDEIAALIDTDRTPRAVLDDVNPLDCRLLDENDTPTLYIEDGAGGEALALELINVSRHELVFRHGPHQQARLTLTFRPGTLAAAMLDTRRRLRIRETGDWTLAPPRRAADGTVTLTLRSLMPDRRLAPGETLVVTFDHIEAAAAHGSRVARVLFAYEGFATAEGDRVAGERAKSISIVSHSGRPHPPLAFEFADTGAVLPGADKVNDLLLRVRNSSANRTLRFLPRSGLDAGSELVFEVEADHMGESRPTALGKIAEIEAIVVEPPAGWDWAKANMDTERPSWVLTPSHAFDLGPGDELTIGLSQITTTNAPGRAPIKLMHRRLPGFWDGEQRLEIDKTPLHFDHHGQVGIGTPNPTKPLTIRGRGGSAEWLALEIENETGGSFSMQWHVNGMGGGLNVVESWTKDGRLYLAPGGRGLGIGTTSVDEATDLHVVNGAGTRLLVESSEGGDEGPSIALQHGDDAIGEIAMDLDGMKLGAGDKSVRLIGNEYNEIGVDEKGAWIGDPNDRENEQRYHALAVYGNTLQRGAVFLDGNAYFVRPDNKRSGPPDCIGVTEYNPGDSTQANLDGKGLTGEPGKIGRRFLQVTGHTNGMLCVDSGAGSFGGSPYTSLIWNALGIRIPRSCTIDEELSAKVKRFRIDHPTRPDAKLVHACLEGPENAVYYRGEADLADGRAIVELPDYFEALTRKEGRTVQLTAKGAEPFLLSYEDVADGRFSVYGTKADGRFSWEVRAVRADVAALEAEPEVEAERTLEPVV